MTISADAEEAGKQAAERVKAEELRRRSTSLDDRKHL
jgi:hypothetical protein